MQKIWVYIMAFNSNTNERTGQWTVLTTNGESWKDMVTNEEVGLKLENKHGERTQRKTLLAWTCAMDGKSTHTTASITLGVSKVQQSTRSTKNKLEKHNQEDLQKTGLIREKTVAAALSRQDWRQSVAKCSYLNKKDGYRQQNVRQR